MKGKKKEGIYTFGFWRCRHGGPEAPRTAEGGGTRDALCWLGNPVPLSLLLCCWFDDDV